MFISSNQGKFVLIRSGIGIKYCLSNQDKFVLNRSGRSIPLNDSGNVPEIVSSLFGLNDQASFRQFSLNFFTVHRGPVDPKFQVEGFAPTIRTSQKTRLNDLSWYKNLDRSFFCFVTMHAFDRQTDGRTEFSSLDRVCIPCSTVKIEANVVVSECTICYRVVVY